MRSHHSTVVDYCDVRKPATSCRFHPQRNLIRNKELRVNAELLLFLLKGVVTSVPTTVRPGWAQAWHRLWIRPARVVTFADFVDAVVLPHNITQPDLIIQIGGTKRVIC